MSSLRQIPSVDNVLHIPRVAELIEQHGRPLVAYAVRRTIDRLRKQLQEGSNVSTFSIVDQVQEHVESINGSSLRKVINATGIILHTNLGRAPLGEHILEELAPIIRGYSNVEFNLVTGERGHRNAHLRELLMYLTGADDVVVVNNNAAGIILTLHTLALNRRVIISRGELIEIGGAFRIPDIMAASGAHMVEVGTTNKTRLSDYEKAITPETALIFKAHKSNYTISGFTEEVSVHDLAVLAHKHGIPFVYDIGSGLLRKPKQLPLEDEPDVQQAIDNGADLVAFSGDKLLGGPQAGIVVGKKQYISKLSKAPLMRALRVGKLTIGALFAACRNYVSDEMLTKNNRLFELLERNLQQLRRMAEELVSILDQKGVKAEIVESTGQCGGGTLPEVRIPSFGVALVCSHNSVKKRADYAEQMYYTLMQQEHPIVGILREGRILFDVLTLSEEEIPVLASQIAFVTHQEEHR